MDTKTVQITCELRYNNSSSFIKKKSDIALLIMNKYPLIQQDELSRITFTSESPQNSITITNVNTVFSFGEDSNYDEVRSQIVSIWKALSNLLEVNTIERLGIRMMELYPKTGIEAVPILSDIFSFNKSPNLIEANCNFVYKFNNLILRVATSNHIHQRFDIQDKTKNFQIVGTMFDLDSYTFKVQSANLLGVLQELISQKNLVLRIDE